MIKKNNKKNTKKGAFIFLIIGLVLLLICAIILYFNGIEDILPICFFLVLPILATLVIFLLSKNIWNHYQKKKQRSEVIEIL